MIRINLLPYRPARRQRQILQHLGVALGAVTLAVMISLGAQWIASSRLSSLKQQYHSLRSENVALMKEIGRIKDLDKLRADVERKLGLVDQLQRGRFRSLNTFVALAKVIPANVWLTSIKDTGTEIRLSGIGESNNAVADFMRALDASPLFTNIRLQVITRTEASGMAVRQFDLVINRVDGDSSVVAHGGHS
jgi:type IV pilus assembly protein PilN